VTKDLPVLLNENAIRRSVRNLVETALTERFFNSSLGSQVYSSLFDFVDYGTATNIQAQVEAVITNYEPRVNNLQVLVDPQPDDNAFSITLIFDIVGQQFPTQEFSFILEATR
jgi:phage baseplate assembly protein W